MRLRTRGHLIGHPWTQNKFAAIFELHHKLTLKDEHAK